jgi:two-component system sensor histidine kinase YesM
MSEFFHRGAWNSIRIKIITGLFFVTVPLLTLLIYSNYYSIDVVRNQVSISNKNLISLYMGQIDTQLDAAEKNILGLVTNNINLQSMEAPYDDDEYQLAKYNLSVLLSNNLLFYKSIDAFFIFSDSRQDLMEVPQNSVSFSEKTEVEKFLLSHLNQLTSSSKLPDANWYVKKIGNTSYVLRTIKTGSLYIGAWVKASTLLGPMNLIDLGTKGSALLITSQGEPMVKSDLLQDENVDLSRDFQKYYMTGTKNDLLVVGEPSQKGGFSLAAVIPNDHILQNLPVITRIIGWSSFAAIALLPLSLYFLHRVLLVPLKRLITVMNKINKGLVNARIEERHAPNEFLVVNHTFNKMMTQIEELKVNVYEEQLSKQKAELQHLQLQINPHFFMNSLNILFNLAQVRNYELIQEMTLCLVRYFRFMFRSNLTFIALEEELEHVRNYIRIQELRFPQHLECSIDYSNSLKDMKVPPLLIQTFLENSIKHGVTLEEPLQLSVSLECKETGLSPYVEIMIRDTGKGFSQSVLEQIRSGNRVVDEQGEHIGIWNVKKRLLLLYGEEATVTCYNGYPTGAVVEIKLPYQEKV